MVAEKASYTTFHNMMEMTTEEPRASMRFLNGVLQQMWFIENFKGGMRTSAEHVWRDVPSVAEDAA